MYYHYSKHLFAPGDLVEARQSFPFPEPWAWASKVVPAVDGDLYIFVVEPVDDLEQSPYHEFAVRSKAGFKVVSKL